jgi:hypothetical protein
MNIDSLNNGRKVPQALGVKKKFNETYNAGSETKVSKTQDTLELSVEALKLQPIRQKIAQGFYDNPNVLKDVAKKLYNQMPKEEK